MKRFLSIFLVAMLIVTCLATVGFAAGNASVSANHKTAKAGDEVTITYTVTGEFANYELFVKADSPLSLVAINGDLEYNINTGKVAWAKGENVSSHSFTATFKVSDSAKPGTYPVSASVEFVSDRNLEDQVVSVTAGSVTIVCDHAWGQWKTEVAADCVNAGTEKRVCSKCGETETRIVDAKGHTWGAWTVTTPGDCYTKGIETRTCSVCGETETRETEKTQHAWGSWTVKTPVTCTEDGVDTRKCSICGEVEERTVASTGHEWGDWGMVKAPTETETGLEERECLKCHEKETREIPALGKDPDIDPIPSTGDITGQVIMTGTLVLAMLAAAYVLFFKRKAAK